MLFNVGIPSKGVLTPHKPLGSCSLINLHFLMPHTAHFDKSIRFSIFVFANLWFLLFGFVL